MNDFDLIVFDWDGTLMDSAGTIAACIQAACQDCGLPVPSEAKARHVIGLSLHTALQYACPEAQGDKLDALISHYRRHYLAQDHLLKLFTGTQALLDKLKASDKKIAVATGKNRRGLDRALNTAQLTHYFDTTRCADETSSKPHPQMLFEICDELAIAPARTLMIGDTTHDLQLAKNAGTYGVGVTFGAHPREQLMMETNIGIFDSTLELQTWLFSE